MEEEKKQNVAECKVCLITYNDTDKKPMCLACGHTICKGCVSVIFSRNQKGPIECPICRSI